MNQIITRRSLSEREALFTDIWLKHYLIFINNGVPVREAAKAALDLALLTLDNDGPARPGPSEVK